MREISLKEISLKLSLKPRELFILLSIGLFLVIFLMFFLEMRLLIGVSLLILIGLPIFFVSALKWRLSSYFFFLYLLLEGIFRKWIMPEYSTPLFFVKHIALVGPYFYLFTRGVKITKKDYPFLGILLCYLIWGVLEALNFRVTTDLRVQILGLITHFWFVPLIFLVPALLNTEGKILRFFKVIAYTSLPIFILGIVQHFSPYFSWINKYAPSQAIEEQSLAFVGDYIRITGVFSYITPYNIYLSFVLIILLYLLLIRRLDKFEMPILLVALSLGITNLVMTGSRAPFVIFIGQALLLLFFSLKGRFKWRKRVFIRFALVIPTLLLIMSYTDMGRKSLSALIERAQASGDTKSRLIGTYTSFFRFIPDAGLVGYGIGTAYQGANNLVEDWKDMPRNFEVEWERIVLEMGLIGLIIVLLLRFYILFYSWRTFKKIKTYELKFIALIVFLFQIPVLFGANIVFNYLEDIKYWFLLGLLVSVNRLERNNAAKSLSISPW